MKTPSKSKAECIHDANEFGTFDNVSGVCWVCGKTANQFPSLLQSAENERRILRCAPPFDAQAEHENDLRYESRVDYESWQYNGPAEMEDQ